MEVEGDEGDGKEDTESEGKIKEHTLFCLTLKENPSLSSTTVQSLTICSLETLI